MRLLKYACILQLLAIAPLGAQWLKGFDFRSTSVYVTDPTNCTYVIGDASGTVRNGVTFGWVGGTLVTIANRSTSPDARLAGVNYQSNTGTQKTFQVTLPSAGTYMVSLAIGDDANLQGYQYVQIRDNGTALWTIQLTSGTALGSFGDATSVKYTAANWPGNNVAVPLTFTTTTFQMVIGAPTAQVNATTIAHLFLNQVVAGTTAPLGRPLWIW